MRHGNPCDPPRTLTLWLTGLLQQKQQSSFSQVPGGRETERPPKNRLPMLAFGAWSKPEASFL